jgi:hypothetical protein
MVLVSGAAKSAVETKELWIDEKLVVSEQSEREVATKARRRNFISTSGDKGYGKFVYGICAWQ